MSDIEFKMCTDPEHEGDAHLPVTEFYRRGNGRQPFCKKCMARRNLRAYHTEQRRKGLNTVSRVDPPVDQKVAVGRAHGIPLYLTTSELLDRFGVVRSDGTRRIDSATVQRLLAGRLS
jgi:hypothetical protein